MRLSSVKTLSNLVPFPLYLFSHCPFTQTLSSGPPGPFTLSSSSWWSFHKWCLKDLLDKWMKHHMSPDPHHCSWCLSNAVPLFLLVEKKYTPKVCHVYAPLHGLSLLSLHSFLVLLPCHSSAYCLLSMRVPSRLGIFSRCSLTFVFSVLNEIN